MKILFDLDGVFYEENRLVQGAADVVHWLKENNIDYLFVTNTSSRPRDALLEKLAALGIHTDKEHVLTPLVATAHWLKQQGNLGKIAVFVPQESLKDFAEFELWQEGDKAVSAVILGDLGESWSYKKLNQAFRLLMDESRPQLIALGMTRYWRASDGLRLDVAPFVVALEYACDTRALVMGKPAENFYRTAMDMLGDSADNIVMIGDDIRSDVQGAQQAGMKGILVQTGKYQASDLQQEIQPDAVLKSVSELPDWWQKQDWKN